REPVVVEAFHQAVDPPEAERFANEVLVGHGLHAGVRLVKDHPHSPARRVVLSEPGAPFCASSDVEELSLSHVRNRSEQLRERIAPSSSKRCQAYANVGLRHAKKKAPARRGQVLVSKTIDQTIDAGPAKSRKSNRDGGI